MKSQKRTRNDAPRGGRIARAVEGDADNAADAARIDAQPHRLSTESGRDAHAAGEAAAN